MLMADNKIVKHFSLLWAYFKFNLSASMEYRSSFLIQVFGMILNNVSFAFFWWLLFEKISTIGGYGYLDVMLLWSLISISFGVTFVLFGNLNRLSNMIARGELDAYLLQPKDPVLNILASKTNISAWGDILYGLCLYTLINHGRLKEMLLLILFTFCGVCIITGFLLTVNSLAFFFGNVNSLAGLAFEMVVTFSIYPEGIFKGIVRWLLFTLIPAGMITMMPVRYLQSGNLGTLGLIVLVSIFWMVLGYKTFQCGLKQYESGNLMIQKL